MQPTVHFLPSSRQVRVPSGTSLLEAVRRAGLPVAAACSGEGACARCAMMIVVAAESLPGESPAETAAKARNRIDAGARLACRVGVTGDMTVTTSYW
jgi:2Fe-2S ferredoxin